MDLSLSVSLFLHFFTSSPCCSSSSLPPSAFSQQLIFASFFFVLFVAPEKQNEPFMLFFSPLCPLPPLSRSQTNISTEAQKIQYLSLVLHNTHTHAGTKQHGA